MIDHARFCSIAMLALAVVATSVSAAPAGWTEDFAAAKAEAEASGKDLFLEFTGSDWCPPCQALNAEVLSTELFHQTANEGFVLVKLDYPQRTPQSEELARQNSELAGTYNIKSFPTVLLADASGKPYAQVSGYQSVGVEAYLDQLEQLKAQRGTRDAGLAKAQQAAGLDKARALDEAMQGLGAELAVVHYPDVVQQIVSLDADNAAGLKDKYQAVWTEVRLEADITEAMFLLQGGDFEAGLDRIDQIIEDHDPQGVQLQIVTTVKAQAYLLMLQTDRAFALFEEAIAIDPESHIAQQISASLEQLRPESAAQ